MEPVQWVVMAGMNGMTVLIRDEHRMRVGVVTGFSLSAFILMLVDPLIHPLSRPACTCSQFALNLDRECSLSRIFSS